MNANEVNTFDIESFAQNLITAGIERDDAFSIAKEAARKSAEALEKAQLKRGLIDVGFTDGAAEINAIAAQSLKKPKSRATQSVTNAGPRSIGDILNLPDPAAKSAAATTSPAAKKPAAKKPAAKKTASKPVSKFKTGVVKKRSTAKAEEAENAPAAQQTLPGVDAPPAEVKKPRAKAVRAIVETPVRAVFDYQENEIPERIRELIETNLAIEAEDAKSAGTMGFMTRSLAIATLPHRRVKEPHFVRKNGDFTLTMMTAHPEGLPFGTMPRLLLTWICTEVAQKGDRVLRLGEDMAAYLDVLGLHRTGGKRGDITRLKSGMTTLFSSVISCHYEGQDAFALNNIALANRVAWWTPQDPDNAGKWQSELELSEQFFKECTEHVLPFDLRAVAALRQSPLALDIYVWLTHRMSYLRRRTIIPWVALAGQFGTGFALDGQGVRDFKRAFLRELRNVIVLYPSASVAESHQGLILYPSPPHVMTREQAAQSLIRY